LPHAVGLQPFKLSLQEHHSSDRILRNLWDLL